MSGSGARRFRYSLDPFLSKRRLDWAAVKIEENQARSIVERREQEVAAIKGAIGEAEHLLRRACEHGAPIDRDQQQNIARYLKHTRTSLAEKHKLVDQANKVHERISRNLDLIRQGIKALEKHKANKHTEHSRDAQRREHNQLDELWLLRTRAGTDIAIAQNTFGFKPIRRVAKNRNGGGHNGG